MLNKKRLAAAKKDALVNMVKTVQKRRMKGSKGDWQDFLNLHDQKKSRDSSLSDPRKRSDQVLVSFLETFTKPADVNFLEKVLQQQLNQTAISKWNKKSAGKELKSSKLVRLTKEHPEYESSYSFDSYGEDWVVTSMGNMSKANKMLAVDCQMLECEGEPNGLVKVCVVDENLKVKLDKLVKITGITAKDLKGGTCSLVDVQKSMKELLSNGTILIGHRLHCHLDTLKLDHARVIDTSLIFKGRAEGKRPSLKRLCKDELGQEVREKGDCLDDARVAMKLVLGFDKEVVLVKDSGDDDLSKQLLLHRIPKPGVSKKELLRAISLEESAVVLKRNAKKKSKQYYSWNAIFKGQHEANAAFGSIQGEIGEDTNGIPQKRITVRLKNGSSELIYVRKMVRDDSPSVLKSSSKKRQFEEVEPSKKKNSDDGLELKEKRLKKNSSKRIVE